MGVRKGGIKDNRNAGWNACGSMPMTDKWEKEVIYCLKINKMKKDENVI